MTVSTEATETRGTISFPRNSQWINLGHGFRLQLKQLEGGWQWSAWEQMTRTGWRALPPPEAQDVAFQFTTQLRAQIFFQQLALLLLPHTGHGEG